MQPQQNLTFLNDQDQSDFFGGEAAAIVDKAAN
jgi:hypothetical protein